MKRFLIVQLRQLGDILLTAPVAEALKDNVPNAHVTFLCHPMGRKVLARHPAIDEVIYYPDKYSWRFLKELRARRYEAVVDFMNNPRSALMTFLASADRKISWDSSRRFFYKEVYANPPGGMYIVEEKIHLLQRAGFEIASPAKYRPRLFPSHEDRQFADAFAQELGSSTWIGLAATHRRPPRKWPYYVELAKALHQQGVSCIWFWGPGEEQEVRELVTAAGAGSRLAPALTMLGMGAVMQKLALVVANSNGPSHVAVAVDVPSLQLHGPTAASSWCPPDHASLQAQSMDQISVAQVLEQVHALLAKIS